jgi:hypothetical protein
MARPLPTLKGDDGKPFTLVIDKFNKGVMTLFDETRLPKEAVIRASNMVLDQDGVWTVRPGTAEYGATLTTPIDGACSFIEYDSDGTYTSKVAVIDNGALKVSEDGGSWTTVSGATWTTGNPVCFKQSNTRLYIANGTDALAYYDIAAGTLTTFTAIDTPGSLVAPTRTGLSAGSYNAYYKITAINSVGETAASSEISVSGGINKTRDNWTTGTDYLTMSWGAVTGATRYNVYYSDSTGTEVFLDSTGTTSYIDTGVATPNPYQEAPADDTTGGPTFGELELSTNRIWATKDPSHPYRVSWAGTGQYSGAFNPFYGGGYIDLDLGGSERPEKVVHFRDGKGTPVATVLTSNPSGAGSTWHIALTTLTVDTLTIVIPQAYKQQGSVGTRSPRGVVEYNDSVYFPSPKGYHALGSQQSILNVLVTDEVSANIRPSVDAINNAYASMICGIAHEGRILWSVPLGSTENNALQVLDVERGKTWALPWSIGVKQFFEYTDSSGLIHLLAVPVAGTKLIEFSSSILGDSGTAFNTSLESGLIHWADDHTSFAYINKVYVEIANPRGEITFTVSGTKKGRDFSSLGSISVVDTVSTAGFSTDLFSDFLFSTSNNTPTTFTQASVKKFLRVNKLLNNLKWQFSSTSVNSNYTPMEIIIKGTILPTSDPSSFKP